MAEPWLDEGEILLHIGPTKTGTTALQSTLANSRERLAAVGVRYPGTRESHWFASSAAMQIPIGGGRIPPRREWKTVLREVAQLGRDRAVISSELFCQATPEHIEDLAAQLGRQRLRVVVAVRALDRWLPSTWQQAVKSGFAAEFEPWVAELLDTPLDSTAWNQTGTASLVDRWGAVVGMDRVAVAVMPTRRPDEVAANIAGLVGIDLRELEPPALSNRSLTVAEARMLQVLFDHVPDLEPRLGQRWLRRGGFLAMVEQRRPDRSERSIEVPPGAMARVAEVQVLINERLRASGAHIVGNLDDVLVSRDPQLSEPTGAEDAPIDELIRPESAALLVTGVLAAAQRDLESVRDQILATREELHRHRARHA